MEQVKETSLYQNPVVLQRADPWVYKHTDGYYYFTASVPEYDRIEIRRSETLDDLQAAEPKAIWRKRESGELSSHIWAPELHFIAGKWYVYFAAARTGANGEGLFDHRMYVLECAAADPFTGLWEEKGQIKTDWESFSLDSTTFEHNGIRYLVWAQQDPAIPGNSNLYIAPMVNPWTIQGPQILLSKPEYDWETIGFLVNEGPAVLKRNGRIFLTYSASATDYNYCMGILSMSDTEDPLNPQAWAKSPTPVFGTNEESRTFGPGHNSFTVSEDGEEDLIVYHARNYRKIVGDPLYDPNRHTRIQRFHWNTDGTPNFGTPVADSR
ncbi:family 43 glycosylhydrolase [Gorillibacterium massiliense]|uniref:glycoside hydrolase family 43 protein n=1 Tax=Gorillibacterium massiliense TaxID=1280390 RepID=UPI0004AEADD1|nr:family 43 glycosylhydrolase [Gorillibacterium massiliense]